MDYYKILIVNIDSSKKEIIEAYKSILKGYSPTSFENPKIAKAFKEIYKAYYILSDEFRREKYNTFYLANQLDSEEYKLWHKNQFTVKTNNNVNNAFSIFEITGDLAGETILDGIFEGALTVVFETIGSIFD